MKLEVGMYVRTYDGYISKCIYINEELENIYDFDSAIRRSFGDEYDFIYCKEQEKYIIKTSHNIIDLIEVGDYVNGMKVTRISGTRYDKNDLHCYCEHNGNENWKQVMIPAKNIKSIVTREKFSQMEYKVGDDK